MDACYLKDKIILILTPQSWGKMKLAKHHFAIELAKAGNQVYYLNPPDNYQWKMGKNRIQVDPVPGQAGLHVISQKLYFPYNLKFHSRKLYNALIKKQIADILDKIPNKIDLIWSFDLGNLFPLSFFDRKIFKVFHPVDEPGDQNAIVAAKGADILFSVTTEIIEKYDVFGIPSFFINHGLPDEFLKEEKNSSFDQRVKVGISGNLLRPDLDRKILLKIILENPDTRFNFYGSYAVTHSNIGATEDEATEIFIDILKSSGNVELHGVLETAELAEELNRMDVLLICYDLLLDQSKGTNYHKVMEYLSTGKVIVSNNITTYRNYPDLVRMIPGRENNDQLPSFFRETITHLDKWNAQILMNERKRFARDNTYSKQLQRIDERMCAVRKEKHPSENIGKL